MQNYAPRVTLPWSDLSGVATIWANYCDKFIVFEHDADEEISQTHCHFLMMGCTVKDEALKRMSKLSGKGNGFWSWIHKDYPTPDENFICYMTKGKLREKFKKNFSDEIVEKQRGLWVEPSKKLAKPAKTVKEDKGSHWDLIMAAWNEIRDNGKICGSVVGKNGEITYNITNHSLAFDCLCRHLNRCKVRTSRNELERFYVTLLRQDEKSVKSLKSSILNNIFRNEEY